MLKRFVIISLFMLTSLLSIASTPLQTGKLTPMGILLILAAVIIVIALLIIWNASQKASIQAPIEEAPPSKAAPVEIETDDLKAIEGIGPKISSLLQSKGINTFAQLAATDPGKLEQILRQANLRIADPSTWPQQATLAAAGKWDDLQALQDDLKGGRVV
jgi:predicted flap endonuclease-1-like 5' DNA nuclease